MNKSELVAQLAEKWVWPKSRAQMALDGVLEIIEAALAKGEDVTLPGFGTFSAAAKPERTGRNPKTGEPLTIAAHKAPKFKPGKSLKDAVNA